MDDQEMDTDYQRELSENTKAVTKLTVQVEHLVSVFHRSADDHKELRSDHELLKLNFAEVRSALNTVKWLLPVLIVGVVGIGLSAISKLQ